MDNCFRWTEAHYFCLRSLRSVDFNPYNQCYNHRSVCLHTRSMSFPSDFALSHRTMMLNGDEPYTTMIDLFEQHQQGNNINLLSRGIIIQTLKACTHMDDLRCRQHMYRPFLPWAKTDPCRLSALIHLYSELWFNVEETTVSFLLEWIAMWWCENGRVSVQWVHSERHWSIS